MARQNREEKGSNDEAFYVGINEPADLRREILESSKLMIHILQSQKKVELLRLEKEKSINDFKRIVREINLIVAKIKKRLPRTKLRALTKEEQVSVYKKANPEVLEKDNKKTSSKTRSIETQKILIDKKQEQKEMSAPEPKRKETELEKLQSQLDDIESKLKSI